MELPDVPSEIFLQFVARYPAIGTQIVRERVYVHSGIENRCAVVRQHCRYVVELEWTEHDRYEIHTA